MTAKIIETNTAEFETVEVDPVTLDIIENALRNARLEMDATLFRTALSPGIREQGDAFPLIAERNGKMIVGQFGSFIDGFLNGYDGTLEDGDVILLNDPYSCEGAISHNNDQLVIMPIFRNGRVISWAAMFGHMTDIGGKVPGSLPTDASSIFEEGLRMPPVKLYRKGELQEDILKIATHQSRMPEWYRADLHAIVASCRVAALRVNEICERFGEDVYASATEELLQRNRRAMQVLIGQAIGEEPVTFEDYICDDGKGKGPFKIKCTMWREGEKVILDFAGTDPQSDSSINFYLNENMFKMFFGIYMIMVFDPQILFNDGFYDLVDVRIPEGSLLKPKFPAALSCRTHALGRIFDVLGALLGQKTPDFLSAAGFSSSPHLMYSGFDKQGEWYQLFQIGFGGIPGRAMGDGPDGHSLWPGFTNVPNEFLEHYFPMLIERYESAADSGGAGLNRGGNGIHMTYRFLQEGKISIHDDRWFVPPWGVNGGKPAARSWKRIDRADGSSEYLGSKVDNIVVQEGDLLHYVTWGGGGWGDPLERDPELVATEVRQGLVSVAGAANYGVVLADNGEVDVAASKALRATISSERDEPGIFDFGPDLDTLRANCEAETGLPAPVQPTLGQPQFERGVIVAPANTAAQGPLTDLRLIELGQLIAGPFCGQLMADMGADVIKVEPPGQGDPMREWGRGDYPLWWTVCARNKRCVTADLRMEEGQALVKELVRDADFLLENFRPGTLERWGLSYETLKEINPRLIMIRVSGYGQTGPYASRAGYAAIGEAMGGMRYLAGWPDRPPTRAGISIGDSLAATYACLGALAALHHRERTGEGQVIDASIFESVLTVMESTIPEFTVSNYIRERSGSALPNIAPSNLYECEDGTFLIAANQDTVFGRLCEAMERPELAHDERYATHTARGAHQAELDEIIQAWTRTLKMDDVDKLMQKHGVPAGRIFRAPEMLDDPHFAAREAIVDVNSERFDNLKMQNIFPRMSATQGEIRWPGPLELGAHNEEVYCGLLGKSAEELHRLREAGVI